MTSKAMLLLLLFPLTSMACDCTAYAIEALKLVHVQMKTVPNLVENANHRYAGDYSEGVVSVINVDDCRVMLHEFVHHVQWLKDGNAKDMHEWQRRELQAAMITMLAANEMKECR